MNKNANLRISEALGIDPIPTPIETLTGDKAEMVPVGATSVAVTDTSKSTEDAIVDEDFAEARENLKGIIEKSDEAINTLQQVAEATEHPRAYEVLATLFKLSLDANKDLLNLSKQRKEITKGEINRTPTQPRTSGEVSPITNNIQNAVFVGTTADLDKMIEEARKTNNMIPNVPNQTNDNPR